uniref:Uncharacterized protein n=1 Tax=Arundo donax TaxID=35708 RepID=A0A0A9G2B9_ARUDO
MHIELITPTSLKHVSSKFEPRLISLQETRWKKVPYRSTDLKTRRFSTATLIQQMHGPIYNKLVLKFHKNLPNSLHIEQLIA